MNTHTQVRRPVADEFALPIGTKFFRAGAASFLELPNGDWFYLSEEGELRRVRVTALGAEAVRERSTQISEGEFRLRLALHHEVAA